jgi:hypothetical protein
MPDLRRADPNVKGVSRPNLAVAPNRPVSAARYAKQPASSAPKEIVADLRPARREHPDVAPGLLHAVLVACAGWITARNREARSDPRGCVHADDRTDPSAEWPGSQSPGVAPAPDRHGAPSPCVVLGGTGIGRGPLVFRTNSPKIPRRPDLRGLPRKDAGPMSGSKRRMAKRPGPNPIDCGDLPREELMRRAHIAYRIGWDVRFKFTCVACGTRCAFADLNKLWTDGECANCGRKHEPRTGRLHAPSRRADRDHDDLGDLAGRDSFRAWSGFRSTLRPGAANAAANPGTSGERRLGVSPAAGRAHPRGSVTSPGAHFTAAFVIGQV